MGSNSIHAGQNLSANPALVVAVAAAINHYDQQQKEKSMARRILPARPRTPPQQGALRLAMQPIVKRPRAASVLCGYRNSDDLAPCPKGKIMSGAILVGGEAVTAEQEVTVDSTMDGKKALGMTR